MATERVRIELGRCGPVVRIDIETRYLGTDILSGKNYERYEVTCLGCITTGVWDGDARHETHVYLTPELRAKLREAWRAKRAARKGAQS